MKRPGFNGIFYILIVVNLVILGWLLLAPPSGNKIQSISKDSGEALIESSFSLTSHEGKKVSDKDFLGKPFLVFFGFTHCPDICPVGIDTTSKALDILGEDASKTNALFVTIDPERDTAEKLSDYLKPFNKNMLGLTGNKEEIEAAERSYRVYSEKVEDKSGGYMMNHSMLIYLMDKEGKYVTHFEHNADPHKIAESIRKRL